MNAHSILKLVKSKYLCISAFRVQGVSSTKNRYKYCTRGSFHHSHLKTTRQHSLRTTDWFYHRVVWTSPWLQSSRRKWVQLHRLLSQAGRYAADMLKRGFTKNGTCPCGTKAQDLLSHPSWMQWT